MLAAVFIGLAAATKQYLVLALPLMFLLDAYARRRGGSARRSYLRDGGAAISPGALPTRPGSSRAR